MANSSGISNNFKWEVMVGLHQLGATTIVSRGSLTSPTTDTVKAALYFASATINATVATYIPSGEIATAGGYTAGGVTVTNATAPTLNGTQGVWTPSAPIVFTNITPGANVDCILIYNSTQGGKSIEVCTFTAQNPVAATLTLTMPNNLSGQALIQIA